MKSKLILTVVTAAMAGLGAVALVTANTATVTGYIGISTALLTTVAVGGFISYNSQENTDIRDAWREKIAMLKNKVSVLEDQNISHQKQIINLENQLEKSRATTQKTDSEQFGESVVVRHVAHK